MNNICVQYCKILGVATRYGLDGPGFEPLTARGSNPGGGSFSGFFWAGPEAHPTSCKTGTPSFFQGQSVRGVAVTTHSHSRLNSSPQISLLGM